MIYWKAIKPGGLTALHSFKIGQDLLQTESSFQNSFRCMVDCWEVYPLKGVSNGASCKDKINKKQQLNIKLETLFT